MAATDDQALRSELSSKLAELTQVEALSSSAFLLSASGAAPQAVVQFTVAEPSWSAEEPAELRKLVTNALREETEGTWFSNDRFSKKTVSRSCDTVVEIVYPADPKDINKRRAEELHRKTESSEVYQNVTVPRLVEKAEQKDKWVVNIIEGKKEQEHVVQELCCEQVLVVKDYKWQDESNVNNLYYLALFKDTTVRSLRDLRGKHLAALQRIRDEVLPGLANKFSVPAEQLLSYVHYHPTFWYFHVHIVNCKHDMYTGEGSSNQLLTAMDRFHKLDTLISLLEANGDFYKTATLPILLRPFMVPWYSNDEDGTSERIPLAKRARVEA